MVNEVNLAGFGKLTVSERAARQGRNPQTGETIQIAAGGRGGTEAVGVREPSDCLHSE